MSRNDQEYQRKYRNEHKQEIREYHKKYREENREKVRMLKRTDDFFKRFIRCSCCVFCFESNPFMLEEHHIFGRKNNLTIYLCSNHHSLLGKAIPRPKLLGFFNGDVYK